MADNEGALSGAYQQSGRETARSQAYGSSGSMLPPEITGALSSIMDPERLAGNESRAFWAGMTGPNNGSPTSSISNALSSQVAARESSDKLKAAYIPLIMQSLTANRSNELAYAKMNMERQKEVIPAINSALYGLQANGQPVDMDKAHQRINDIGMQYGMDPKEMYPHHYALQAGAGPDGKNLQNYLQQLRVSAAPAAEGIGGFGKNAAGQDVIQNKITGSIGSPGSQGSEVNPTSSSVKAGEAAQGDIKGYGEGLGGNVSTYAQMLQRMNAVNDSMKEFQPGKYAGVANSMSAALTDIAARFPNASSETIKKFAEALVGGPNGKGNPVAAAQFAEAVKTQETIAQVKTMLSNQDGGNAGRLTNSEFKNTLGSIPGNLTDPGAFQKFLDFTKGQYSNSLNKYKGWGDYLKNEHPGRYSTLAFDVPWSASEAERLQKGQFGDVTSAPGKGPAPVPPVGPKPVPQATTEDPRKHDLMSYEPGSVVGPTGKVLVRDAAAPMGWRLAKKRLSREASGQVTGGQ